jgi:hypothetical protein
MKRLFVKHFEKQFEDYKISLSIAKIGALEFTELRRKHAKALAGVSSDDVEKINQALASKDDKLIKEIQDSIGIDTFLSFEAFSSEMMLKSIDSIKINEEEHIPEEVFPQLQIEELNWIAEMFSLVNKGLFDSKKK